MAPRVLRLPPSPPPPTPIWPPPPALTAPSNSWWPCCRALTWPPLRRFWRQRPGPSPQLTRGSSWPLAPPTRGRWRSRRRGSLAGLRGHLSGTPEAPGQWSWVRRRLRPGGAGRRVAGGGPAGGGGRPRLHGPPNSARGPLCLAGRCRGGGAVGGCARGGRAGGRRQRWQPPRRPPPGPAAGFLWQRPAAPDRLPAGRRRRHRVHDAH